MDIIVSTSATFFYITFEGFFFFWPIFISFQCNNDFVHTLFQAFSRDRHLNKFCLGHLYTSYAFPDNVLGLAFIAPESVSSAGGICSVRKFKKFLVSSPVTKK